MSSQSSSMLHGGRSCIERGQRRRRGGQLPLGVAPQVPGVHAVAPGAVAEHRRGLADLPPRHRPEPGVGRQQVDQVGGARAGEADHDHRRVELDLERLGIAAHEVLEPQASAAAGPRRRSRTRWRPRPESPASASTAATCWREPLHHAGVAEVGEAGLGPGPGHQLGGVEVDLHGQRHVVDRLLLRPSLRVAQVLDPHLLHGRLPVVAARRSPRRGRMPSSAQHAMFQLSTRMWRSSWSADALVVM